jgi:hypothetical protein
MAMNGKEFKEWAATIGDDDMVAVDDGGLCLVVETNGKWSEAGTENEPWLEIGGVVTQEWRNHEETADALVAHFKAKYAAITGVPTQNINVWCFWDENREDEKNCYCLRGESLPPHPDLRDQYPNGWSLLSHITPARAREILGGKA